MFRQFLFERDHPKLIRPVKQQGLIIDYFQLVSEKEHTNFQIDFISLKN